MEDQIQPNIPPAAPPPQVSVLPLTKYSKILIFISLGLVVAMSVFVGIQIGRNQIMAEQQTTRPAQTAINPTASPTTADPTTNPTTDWKTYTNTAGYSIKYPASFITQLLAAGAGNREATSTTRNLFIFKSGTLEPYIERYINLEIFQGKPTYSQGTITEAMLDNRTVEKIVIPDAKFDIYSAQVGDKEFIEIYVSNDPTKKEIANQILSTFKFTN